MRGLRGGLAAAVVFVVGLVAVPGAGAVGYQFHDVVETGAIFPNGVAVDQESGDVYVANYASSFSEETGLVPGTISKFDADGTPDTPASMGSDYYSGVAIGNQTVFGFSPLSKQVSSFDFAGLAGVTFEANANGNSQIAADPMGNVYTPDNVADVIKKFTGIGGEGTPATIDCAACPAPTAFNNPGSVAIDPTSGAIFVADTGNQRVVKFDASGENPVVFATQGAQAVAVDPARGNVFVGGNDGSGFHVTVFDPSGEEIDNFGEGTFASFYASLGANQLAVNEITGRVYVTDAIMTEAGPIGLLYMFDPIAPTAATTAASALTQTKATLNGTVNPNEGGDIEDCFFEWGTTTAYSGGTVPCASDPEDGNAAVPVSGTLEGLSLNTTYHYQLVVNNGTGPVEGGDQAFTTLPDKPLATTEAATGATQSTATLNGTINAEGDNAACKFEYGTSAAYGQSAPCSLTPVTGTAPTAVSAALSGLSAATTYHFRVVGTNKGGTTNGADLTFTTPAAPPPPPPGGGTTAPPAPLPTTPTPPVTKKPLKCKKGFKKKTVKGKQKCVKVKRKHKKR